MFILVHEQSIFVYWLHQHQALDHRIQLAEAKGTFILMISQLTLADGHVPQAFSLTVYDGGLTRLVHHRGDTGRCCSLPAKILQEEVGEDQGHSSPPGNSSFPGRNLEEGHPGKHISSTSPGVSQCPSAQPWLLLQVSERTLFKHIYSGPQPRVQFLE